jgi:hypothetical protein
MNYQIEAMEKIIALDPHLQLWCNFDGGFIPSSGNIYLRDMNYSFLSFGTLVFGEFQAF